MKQPVDILLVEDDPHDVELTVRALEEHKLINDIQVARDGAEALEYLFPPEGGQARPAPRCVLLDLQLPKVDGHEILQRIKENPRTCKIPVVVLTSSREGLDLERAYALGANSYLCKPVDFHGFTDAIRQVGYYWMLLNEPLVQ